MQTICTRFRKDERLGHFSKEELKQIQADNPHLQGLSDAELAEFAEDERLTQEQRLGAPPGFDEG